MNELIRSAFLLAASLWAMALPLLSAVPSFRIEGADSSSWTKILGSVGIPASPDGQVVITGPSASAELASLARDHILVVIGDSPLARHLGFAPDPESVFVRGMIDRHAPEMQIVWANSPQIPVFEMPDDVEVFAYEKRKKAPLAAGRRSAHGAVLWLACEPGAEGYERFPYLLQTLADLGLVTPVRSTALWSFFDSAYRSGADFDYLARRWRKSGIAALHIAAWRNMTPDAQRDEQLDRLISACHRNAVLVYAWLELPHVSDEMWAKHPEWREKTAVGEDAQLDWRKLMNLQNADCRREASKEVRALLTRFDWDGVNMAELYFESLEGAANPARFTPMNADVRRAFQAQSGFDPQRLFDAASPHSAQHDPAALRKFLDFRTQLAVDMQAEWLGVAAQVRGTKPWLDVVLTQVDDRLDPTMRDALGADTTRSLPLWKARKATVLVEDPATLWNLGASRYAQLALKWASVPLEPGKVAVDLNIVERYQDVYPTKKQTGTELFELVHEAAHSFGRVALYFESSLERQDLDLLPASAANASLVESAPDTLSVESAQAVRVLWSGPAEVDGKPWPIANASGVLLPAGKHTLTAGMGERAAAIADFNGNVRNAIVDGETVELAYGNSTRALLTLGAPASSIDIDGTPFWKPNPADPQGALVLPAGDHIVSIHR